MMIIEKSHPEINKKYKNNILNFSYIHKSAICILKIYEQIFEDKNLSQRLMISVHQTILRIHLEYMGRIS